MHNDKQNKAKNLQHRLENAVYGTQAFLPASRRLPGPALRPSPRYRWVHSWVTNTGRGNEYRVNSCGRSIHGKIIRTVYYK